MKETNNAKILKEMASKGLAIKIKMQDIDTEQHQNSEVIMKLVSRNRQLGQDKTKLIKKMLDLFQ